MEQSDALAGEILNALNGGIAGDHRISALGVVDHHDRAPIEARIAQIGLLLRPKVAGAPGAMGRARLKDGAEGGDIVLQDELDRHAFLDSPCKPMRLY